MARTDLQKQRRRFVMTSWTGAALVLGILAAANFVLSVFPLRVDTSPGGAYSLTDSSRKVLSQLDDRLLVRIVFSRDLPPAYQQNRRYVADLLSEYKRASGGTIRVEAFDPAANPKNRELAMDFGVMPVQLDVVERDRREVAEKFMGVAFFYGDRTEAIAFVQDIEGLEYEITLRIRKLIDPTRPTVALLNDGGAPVLGADTLQTIGEPLRQVYDVKTISAAQPIPDDVRAAWWLGPRVPSTGTAANLKAFLARGGALGLMVDQFDVNVAQFRSSPVNHGLETFLAEWGVEIKRGFVLDPNCDRVRIRASQGAYQMINVVDYPYFPLISNLNRAHPASRSIDAVTMPFLSPVEVFENKPGLAYTPIGFTSNLSYLDTEPYFVNPLDQRPRPPTAAAGPFRIGLLVEGKFAGGEKLGRLILFGTSRFIRSEYPSHPSNYAFFFNFLDWSAQDELMLRIRSKGLARRPLRRLPDGVRIAYKYAMTAFLPLSCLLVGLVVWRRQRVRRALLPLLYREA